MKVLASDLDGTLYFHKDGGFRESDLAAIRQFRAEGNLLGTCTGRPYVGVKPLMSRALDFDFYIVGSGSQILDKDGRVLVEKLLSKDVAQEIFASYYSLCECIIMQTKHMIYALKDMPNFTLATEVLPAVKDYPQDDIYGLSVRAYDEETAAHFVEEFQQHFGDHIEAWQNNRHIDVVPKGCSKGKALLQLKELMGFSEISGIGDSYNDLPMLQAADISFTFHTSPEKVKRHADHLVDSVAEAIHILQG